MIFLSQIKIDWMTWIVIKSIKFRGYMVYYLHSSRNSIKQKTIFFRKVSENWRELENQKVI